MPNLPLSTEFPLGSHLISERNGYIHHGIYVGNGQVIHYSGWNDFLDFNGKIERVNLAEFQNDGEKIRLYASPKCARFSVKEIVARAESRLGESEYSLFSNNCEHFANWCFYGEENSIQINQAMTAIALLGARLAYKWLKSR